VYRPDSELRSLVILTCVRKIDSHQTIGQAGARTVPTIGSEFRTQKVLACGSCGRYLAEMVKNPQSRRRSASNARPFFELIAQMETLLETIELDWPEDMRTDAKRRLARIARALRYAPETRERLLNVT
jgi:hypothetical protein